MTEDPSRLADYFKVDRTVTDSFDFSYNVAPTDPVYAVAEHDGVRQIGRFRWGLVPHWAKDTKGALNINARSETVATKASFRDSFRRKRCIIPATGFFEWEPKERGRLPHYIPPDRRSTNGVCRGVGVVEGPYLRRVASKLLHNHDQGQ